MSLFRRKKKEEKIPWVGKVELPPERQTQESADVSLALDRLVESYSSLAHSLPFELYDYVELVALYNPDFSQAVNNIKNLANPNYKIIVNSEVEARAQNFRERLKEKQRTIKPRIGGFDGIIDALLYQAAIYGAMCGEWVLNEDISDVVDFVIVSPKYIRFFWDKEKQDWHPYQKVSISQLKIAEEKNQEIRGSCVKLNTNTFMYQSILNVNNNPYGIPPLFASLENISIQREMINNLKSVTKKLGMLGILELIVERLPMMPEETPGQYQQRCGNILQNYTGLIQDMINEGGVAHFDDTKVTNLSIADRVQGADAIFQLNEEQIFSGLHSLPSIQGRSYSTTETYAGVAYELLLRSIGDFRRAVKFIMEQGCWLMSMVWGLNVKEIEFKFGENKSLHMLQEAQAEAITLNNDMRMWQNGLLNQQQVSQRHGIDTPAVERDIPVEPPPKQQLEYGPQDSMGKAVDAIYKEAINFDPNKELKDDIQEYINTVYKDFQPVQDEARKLIEAVKKEL